MTKVMRWKKKKIKVRKCIFFEVGNNSKGEKEES